MRPPTSIETLEILEGEIQGHAPRDYEDQKRSGSPLTGVEFDEKAYLTAFPDIAEAISGGEWASGREHYEKHGVNENRLSDVRYRNAANAQDTPSFPASDIDAAFVSRSGWCLVIGWINDRVAPLRDLACLRGREVIAVTWHLARCRREDAEDVVSSDPGALLGFWTVFRPGNRLVATDEVKLCLCAGLEQRTFAIRPKIVDDEHLREVALEYLATARYFNNPQIEAVLQLKDGLGAALVNLNIGISTRIVRGAHVARFGAAAGPFDGSIVVCLFGKAEYLFLQAAAFSGCPGADRYEFVYVSNSPELGETLLKEAAMAARIYGISLTLVILPGNAGFGAANNIAAQHARSDRILIVNPDVFPRDRDWAVRHSSLIQERPPDQTAIFGAPLYYDDGSLMHAGMYFDIDSGVTVRNGRVQQHDIIRVEHYGKGAPPDTPAFLVSRQVPAVTGAFISLDRAWFDAIGGFSLEYVFGHYEDADLCLRSLSAGKPVWVHPVPFWHLEGKGSSRRMVHEGGSTVNRWHFTQLWADLIAAELRGPAPSRLTVASQ